MNFGIPTVLRDLFNPTHSLSQARFVDPPMDSATAKASLKEALQVNMGNESAYKKIVHSAVWENHPETHRQIIDISKNIDHLTAQTSFADLLNDENKALSADSNGQTLLGNLQRLATQTMHTSIPTEYKEVNKIDGNFQNTQQSMVEEVLTQICATGPDHFISQNNFERTEGAPTCAATAAQYKIATERPAEYVRLLSGIVGSSGEVDMQGGDPLDFHPEIFNSNGTANTNGRGLVSTIFQSAATDYANGSWIGFDARTNGLTFFTLNPFQGKAPKTGVDAEGVKNLLSQLEGTSMHTLSTNSEIDSFVRAAPETNAIVILDDGTTEAHAVVFKGLTENGKLNIYDPNGFFSELSLDEFKQHAPQILQPELV